MRELNVAPIQYLEDLEDLDNMYESYIVAPLHLPRLVLAQKAPSVKKTSPLRTSLRTHVLYLGSHPLKVFVFFCGASICQYVMRSKYLSRMRLPGRASSCSKSKNS